MQEESYHPIRWVLLFLSVVLLFMTAAQAEPAYLEPARSGLLVSEVDITACALGAPQCEGFPRESAAATNNNPVHLVVQVSTPMPVDDFTPASFSVETQISPSGLSTIVPYDCPDCFRQLPGGLYSMWLTPLDGPWEGGTYFLRLGVITGETILPALVRIDIPFEPFLPTGEPPMAMILAIPPDRQIIDRPVLFDGSQSYDPDSPITCYQWSIDSNLEAYDEIVQGPSQSALQRTYPEVMEMSVLLRVSDQPDAGRICGSGEPPVSPDLFSPNIATLAYTIDCDNLPPVADAGPDIMAPPGSTVLLDGSGSYDPDGMIDRYQWNCGNGIPPIHTGPPSQVYCRYLVPGRYAATLRVYDDGTGRIDPDTGTFECQKSDTDETLVTIVVPGD